MQTDDSPLDPQDDADAGDEALRARLFPDLTLEQFRAMRNRQRQSFNDLSPDEQERVRKAVDRLGESAAGAVADGAIRKARSGR